MKIVINSKNLVIATHQDSQDIRSLYDNKDLSIIRIPDHIKIKYDNYIDNDKSPTLPTDPRINWSLTENKKNAIAVIEDVAEEYRIKKLSNKPARIAGYESKVIIANRILDAKSPNINDLKLFQLESDNRNISVPKLAEIIIKKNQEFANLSAIIDGQIQLVKSKIKKDKNYQDVWNHIKKFEDGLQKLTN